MAVLVLCPATEKEVRSQLPWDSETVDYDKLIVYWPIKTKVRIYKLTSTPQTS